jgi:hypothetical protein
MIRLKTLESIWIQGKLRMWGRWSYIGGGSGGNMFNQLLAAGKVTKTAINDALRRMKKPVSRSQNWKHSSKNYSKANIKAVWRSAQTKKR